MKPKIEPYGEHECSNCGCMDEINADDLDAETHALLARGEAYDELIGALKKFDFDALHTFVKSGSANGRENLRCSNLAAITDARALLARLEETPCTN